MLALRDLEGGRRRDRSGAGGRRGGRARPRRSGPPAPAAPSCAPRGIAVPARSGWPTSRPTPTACCRPSGGRSSRRTLPTCADCRATLFGLREAALRYRSLPVPEPAGRAGSRITRALGLVGLPGRAAAADAVAERRPPDRRRRGNGGARDPRRGSHDRGLATGPRQREAGSRADPGVSSSPWPSPTRRRPAPVWRPASSPSSRRGTCGPPPTLPPCPRGRRGGSRRRASRRANPPSCQGLGRSFAPDSPPPATPPPPPPAAPATPVDDPQAGTGRSPWRSCRRSRPRMHRPPRMRPPAAAASGARAAAPTADDDPVDPAAGAVRRHERADGRSARGCGAG